jgi:hypothetical protein
MVEWRPHLDAGRRSTTPARAERAVRLRDAFVRGLSSAEAATQLNMTRDTVQRYISLLRLEGLEPLKPQQSDLSRHLRHLPPSASAAQRAVAAADRPRGADSRGLHCRSSGGRGRGAARRTVQRHFAKLRALARVAKGIA